MPTMSFAPPQATKILASVLLLALAAPAAAQERLPWLRDEPAPVAPSYDEPRSRVDRDQLPPPAGSYGSSAPRAGAPTFGGQAYDAPADRAPAYGAPNSSYGAPSSTYGAPVTGRRDDAYRSGGRDGGYAAPLPSARDDAYRPPARYGASPSYDPAPTYEPAYRDEERYDRPRSRQASSEPRPYINDREPPPRDGTFSMNEIVHAGHGFFGSISQGLASVLEYTFKTQGRPNGYILGEDIGGAFVAGLRYGEGRLHTRDAGTHRVYWQGPSLGYDAGAEGSKVMVLVYNMREPEDIYQRFGGVAGSAYVVGGVGLTFQRRDDIVLAPIRAGLGLRLGANVGYLKYTRRPTWNPF